MYTQNDLVPVLKEKYKKFGVAWDEVNIFGVRLEENQPEDVFNDYIGLARDGEVLLFDATTDPGWHYTQKPFTVEGITGAAHLCIGYHPNIWIIDIHAKGSPAAHRALCQYGNAVKIWRDVDKDGDQDASDVIQSGYFGINLHRAGLTHTKNIGLWSAGCQVMQSVEDFKIFLGTLEATVKYKENPRCRWSYFLFDKKELPL